MRLRAFLLPGPGGNGPADGSESDRGISPVIAVVLLLAITVLLAAVAAPFVFGVVGDFESETPDADFAFLYEEGESFDLGTSTDDFGTPLDQGDGLLTVQLERGESLDPANLEIRGVTSGGNLLNDTADTVFAPGDRVRDGAMLRVTAQRGETVQVIWTGESGEESAIIGEFVVDGPGTFTPPWVPETDVGCEYIEDQLTDTENDIEVTGVVVECDLDQYYPRINAITIQSENGELGAVVGDVNGTGQIDIINGGTFQGNVESGADGTSGNIYIKDGSTVYSDVISKGDGDIYVRNASTVEGRIQATGITTIEGDSSVSGEIVSGTDGTDGKVVVRDSSVGDDITVEGQDGVDIESGSTVTGSVEAPNDVNVRSGSEITGDIVAGTDGSDGQIDITGSSAVGGGVTAAGTQGVYVDDSAVDGPVTAAGDVDVQSNSRVGGTIVAGTSGNNGKVNVKSSSLVDGGITVEGQSGVDVDGGSTVRGPIDAPQPVNVQGNSLVTDTIVADEKIFVSSSTVDGRLDNRNSGKNIDVDNSEIGGRVFPGNVFECDSSTVRGKSCDKYKNPRLTVNITDTNSPVTRGNSLYVDVTVENNGFSGQRDIQLLLNGSVEKTKQTDLSRNQQSTYQFEWDTSGEDTGPYNVTVTSDADSDTTSAYVSDPTTAAFAVETVNADAEVYAGKTLSVSATIRNSGEVPGTKTVRLQDFDGNVVDSTTEDIEDGETKTVTLAWDTTSGDIGTGQVTVDTDSDAGTASVEVLENVYDIEDVALYRSGQDLDVEVFLNVSNPGTVDIEVFDEDGTLLDDRTVDAESDVYTMLKDEKAKTVDGEVVVTLYDKNGDQRDTMSKDWNGGRGGGGGG